MERWKEQVIRYYNKLKEDVQVDKADKLSLL